MTKHLAHWPSVTGGFLEVGGRPIRVLRTTGRSTRDAVPQLLVHGLGGSAAGWVEVMEG